MMQMNEIQRRLDHIGQTVHDVSQACQNATLLPMELKDCIQQLDEKSEQIKRMAQKTQDEQGIKQYIDDLEQLGDKAKDACERADRVEDEIRQGVMQAHQELSDLKRQLH